MIENDRALLLETLETVASGQDEPIATLAEGLILAAGADVQSLEGPQFKEVRERISSITEQLAARGQGPGAILEALLKIDTTLAAKTTVAIPWASRLATLTAERALHAERKRAAIDSEQELSHRSPIVRTDEHTLLAVPVGFAGSDAIVAFSDRILKETLKNRIKHVTLILTGLNKTAAASTAWDDLEADLQSQKIRLHRVPS